MADLIYREQELTDEDYRNFEQHFARELPPSFRAHYMSFNGGSPSEEDVEAGRWGLPVHGFNAIKYGRLPIEQLIERMGAIEPEDDKFGSWAPWFYVPFAYDEGGNPLFLSLRDSDYGCVYIYAPDGRNIHRVATSFEEFRERLYRGKERRQGAALDQSVIVSNESFATDEDIIRSNITFVTALFAEHLQMDEIAPDALRSHYVDYYRAQVLNGGFSQFVYNSAPAVIRLVKEGLAAMKAVRHLKLFEESSGRTVDRLGPEQLQAFLESDYFGDQQKGARDILNANDDRFVELSKSEDLIVLNAAWLRSLPGLQVKTIDDMWAEVERRAAALPDREERKRSALVNEPRCMKLIRALCLEAGHRFWHMNGYDDRRQHNGKTVPAWRFTTDKGDYYMVEVEGRAAMFTDGFGALFVDVEKPVAAIDSP